MITREDGQKSAGLFLNSRLESCEEGLMGRIRAVLLVLNAHAETESIHCGLWATQVEYLLSLEVIGIGLDLLEDEASEGSTFNKFCLTASGWLGLRAVI